jgi:hypothetical protein
MLLIIYAGMLNFSQASESASGLEVRGKLKDALLGHLKTFQASSPAIIHNVII